MGRFQKFQLGEFTLYALEDLNADATLKDHFPSVNEHHLAEAIKKTSHPKMDLQIGYNCLLIDTGKKRILIDAGTGKNHLLESLQQAGFLPSDIDAVMITHGDTDHVGGLDSFKNAEVILPSFAWELWNHPAWRKIMCDDFERVFKPYLSAEMIEKGMLFRYNLGKNVYPDLGSRLRLVQAEEDVFPGIRMISSPGHRPDHFAVEIESEGNTLLHVADAIRHPIQIENPNWYSRFDSDPVHLESSIIKLTKRAKTKKASFFLAHLPFPGILNLPWTAEKIKLFSS